MDLNKAILYGQLVNEAYKVSPSDLSNRAGTTVTVERGSNKTTFDVIASIYANDLATDASKKRGPVAPVSIGLLLRQADSAEAVIAIRGTEGIHEWVQDAKFDTVPCKLLPGAGETEEDRKSTRLNSSHQIISYAVFCLKKKKKEREQIERE